MSGVFIPSADKREEGEFIFSLYSAPTQRKSQTGPLRDMRRLYTMSSTRAQSESWAGHTIPEWTSLTDYLQLFTCFPFKNPVTVFGACSVCFHVWKAGRYNRACKIWVRFIEFTLEDPRHMSGCRFWAYFWDQPTTRFQKLLQWVDIQAA